jgi:hypothetical protein
MTVPWLPLSLPFFRPTTIDRSRARRGSITILTLWWVGVAVTGCAVLVAHTRDTLRRSCAEALADAVVLAHVSHGARTAEQFASGLEARIDAVVVRPDGSVEVTVVSHCGTATSAALVE